MHLIMLINSDNPKHMRKVEDDVAIFESIKSINLCLYIFTYLLCI